MADIGSDLLKEQERAWNKSIQPATHEGLFIGQVMDDVDESHLGRLWVSIPEISVSDYDNRTPDGAPVDRTNGVSRYDANIRKGWIQVYPVLPFGGHDGFRGNKSGSVNSFGLWGQPRVGDYVAVMFAKGDAKIGLWLGVVPAPGATGMVPGTPAPTGEEPVAKADSGIVTKSASSSASVPVRDKVSSAPNEHGEVDNEAARNIVAAGLGSDIHRGAGTSGARRESPSYVYGIKTPGWSFESERNNLDVNGKPFSERAADLGGKKTVGHSFVMDDHPDHQLIRLRTSNGAQILMNDSGEIPYIYIQTAKGNVWMEMDDAGNLKIYSGGDISVHSEGDYNLVVDGDFNVDIGGDYNIRVKGDTTSHYVGAYLSNHGKSYGVTLGGSYSLLCSGFHVQNGGDFKFENAGNVCFNSASGYIEMSSNKSMFLSSQGDFEVSTSGNYAILTGEKFSIDVGSDILLKTEASILGDAAGGVEFKAIAPIRASSDDNIEMKSGGTVYIDGGPAVRLNEGGANPASEVSPVLTSEDLGGECEVDSNFIVPRPKTVPVPTPPTKTDIINGTPPTTTTDSVAPIVPQRQPWVGRANIGQTPLQAGYSPIPTSLADPSKLNVSKVQGDLSGLKLNLHGNLGNFGINLDLSLNPVTLFNSFRKGSMSASVSIPDITLSLGGTFNIGGLTVSVGIPAFHIGTQYTSTRLGEKPTTYGIGQTSILATHPAEEMVMSKQGLSHLKYMLGFTSIPRQLPGGIVIGGYGTRVGTNGLLGDLKLSFSTKNVNFTVELDDIIDLREANEMLQKAIEPVEKFIQSMFAGKLLTQAQFDMLVAMAFSAISGNPMSLQFHIQLGTLFQYVASTGDVGSFVNVMLGSAIKSSMGGSGDLRMVNRRRYEATKMNTPEDPTGVISNTKKTYNSPSAPPIFSSGYVKVGQYTISNEVVNAIINARKNYAMELPDGVMFTIAAIESSFDPHAYAGDYNPDAHAGGLYQFTLSTGEEYGIPRDRSDGAPVFDPVINANAGARFIMNNYRVLQQVGIPISATEIYVTHFLGLGGGKTFLRRYASRPNSYPHNDPDMHRAIVNNRSIFYKNYRRYGKKYPRTYGQVYALLDHKTKPLMQMFAPFEASLLSGAGGPYTVGTGTLPWTPASAEPIDFTNVDPSLVSLVEKAGSAAGVASIGFIKGYSPSSGPDAAGNPANDYYSLGKALLVDISQMSNTQRRAFIEYLAKNGAKGLGIGISKVHVDLRSGGKVAWKLSGGNGWCRDILKAAGFRGA